jgi:hypothetical protein
VNEDAIRALTDKGVDDVEVRLALEDEEPSSLYAAYVLMARKLNAQKSKQRDLSKPRLLPPSDAATMLAAKALLSQPPKTNATDIQVISAALQRI